MSTGNAKDAKPFPLGNTLRDLALLRASEIDISSLLGELKRVPEGSNSGDASTTQVGISVDQSYKFVRETRMAIKMHNRGDAETQGKRVEEVRCQLDELVKGLETRR